MRHHIGTGRLTWNGSERRSDRYGTIFLIQSGDSTSPETPPLCPITLPADSCGKLFALTAKITENRESTHIGDIFHGVFPRLQPVGTVVDLGVGYLSVNGSYLSLVPVDKRSTQRMSMRGLYDAHEQTVELWIEDLEEQSCPRAAGG